LAASVAFFAGRAATRDALGSFLMAGSSYPKRKPGTTGHPGSARNCCATRGLSMLARRRGVRFDLSGERSFG